MAKLEGVKVIDMVDGEATKVTYNGEEYKLTEDEAQVGDIMRPNGTHFECNIMHYKYYDVIEVSEGSICVIDEEGDRNGIGNLHADIFRKASTTSLDERVSTLETTAFSLESRVQALEKDGPTSEKIYDKPARVGDTIRITDAHILNKGRDYDNGDVMTVEHIEVDHVEAKGIIHETDKYDGFIADHEYEIIGRGSEEKDATPEIIIGKTYVTTEDGYFGDIPKDTRVKFDGDINSRGFHRVYLLDASDFDRIQPEHLAELRTVKRKAEVGERI